MKTAVVNTYDKGGAGKACVRLHNALMNNSVESNLVLLHKSRSDIENASVFVSSPIIYSNIQKLGFKLRNILRELKLHSDKDVISEESIFLETRNKKLEMFSFLNSEYDLWENEYLQNADVINLHWVANFLDYRSFFKQIHKPIVWTLHDMNPFLGGEHYKERYMGIDTKGYPIKRVYTKDEIKWRNKLIEEKQQIFNSIPNLHIVALCNWMKEEVESSSVFGSVPVSIIPNSLDFTIYQPRDKYFARELLGLPQDKKIVLFVVDNYGAFRKGFDFLQAAMESIDDKDIVLCGLGNKMPSANLKVAYYPLSFINDERLMSVVYSGADVFVIPSLEENLPNTVMESLACGTPVVGFPTGGIVDMVTDGVNGFLTKKISVNSLKTSIELFFQEGSILDRNQIHEQTKGRYNRKIQTDMYLDLFNAYL